MLKSLPPRGKVLNEVKRMRGTSGWMFFPAKRLPITGLHGKLTKSKRVDLPGQRAVMRRGSR